MNTIILQNWQTQDSNIFRDFSLSVLAGIHAVTDRIKNLILNIMAVNKALLYQFTDFQANSNYRISIDVGFIDTVNDLIVEVAQNLDVYFDSPVDVTDDVSFITAIKTKILSYASSQGYSALTVDDIIVPMNSTKLLNNMGQTAIADAPADAVTNYNVVTTLLGGLTGAVNTANTKQNDIATKLNSVLLTLRTAGIIVP